MRISGKITYWNAEKAYGFITPSSGAKQVFVHVNAFGGRVDQPKLNQLVSFVLSTDKQGRPCAVRVALAGEETNDRFRRNDSSLFIAAASLFLLFLGVAVLSGELPLVIFVVYLVMSSITFIAYKLDKSAAAADRQRTPENTLHALALFGGWPGAMIAQQLLRHKSSKESFRAMFWVTVVLNCAVLIWLFTVSGAALLQQVMQQVS